MSGSEGNQVREEDVEATITRAISSIEEIKRLVGASRDEPPASQDSGDSATVRAGGGDTRENGSPDGEPDRENMRKIIKEVLDSGGLLDEARKKLTEAGFPEGLVREEILLATRDIVQKNAVGITGDGVLLFLEPSTTQREEKREIEVVSGGRFARVKERIRAALSGGVVGAEREIDETKWFRTGIPGVDVLFANGALPRGSAVLLIGGPGSGKTLFALQSMYKAAERGERALFVTLEEEPERLFDHMRDFGWDPDRFVGSRIRVLRLSPFDISRSVEALLEKEKGDLEIDVRPIMIDEDYSPTVVYIDSISAIAAAFSGEERSYRVYIDQLFRMLREMKVTSFLISETEDTMKQLTPSGVEEFLADGVLVIHTIRRGDKKLRGFEIYKMRGTGFEERIVAMRITPEEGVSVYPEEKVYEF